MLTIKEAQRIKHFLKHNRARLIKEATQTEKKVYQSLTSRGIFFDFQHIIGRCIVDFHFTTLKKIIEIDGACFHNTKKDEIRDERHKDLGYKTLRVNSHRVHTDFKQVMREIVSFLYDVPIPTSKQKRKELAMKLYLFIKEEREANATFNEVDELEIGLDYAIHSDRS